MRTTLRILAVTSCACMILTSCRNPAGSPEPCGPTGVCGTAEGAGNAGAKPKGSPDTGDKEAWALARWLDPGMTREQVMDIHGAPDNDPRDGTYPDKWEYKVFYGKPIRITFENDKVVKVEFIRAK